MDNMIGNRIKERRKELKLTQMQVYAETGISSGNMSEIENGRISPSATTLVLLSKILNCSIDWILTGTESLKNDNQFFSNIEDYEAFKIFMELSDSQKEEIVELMKFKIFKYQTQKSSPSEDENNAAGIA